MTGVTLVVAGRPVRLADGDWSLASRVTRLGPVLVATHASYRDGEHYAGSSWSGTDDTGDPVEACVSYGPTGDAVLVALSGPLTA